MEGNVGIFVVITLILINFLYLCEYYLTKTVA